MTIEERVATLERSNRRLRLVLLGSAALISAFAIAGSTAPPGAIRARSLEIVDSSARNVLSISAEQNGPVIQGLDAGSEVFSLTATGLNVQDRGHSALLSKYGLSVSEDGNPRILAWDMGGPDLQVVDRDGNEADFGVTFVRKTRDGYVASVPARADDIRTAASVVLFGKDHKVIWKVP